MVFTDHHLKILTYFFERGNEYLTEKEAPVEIAGIGYRPEFRNTIYQLYTSRLLEKEVQQNLLKHSDDRYRISPEGRKVILKGKTDAEIKHIILGLLKTNVEQPFQLNDLEQAIPIERDRIAYLLEELEEDKNVIIKRLEDSDNCLIITVSKGVKSYLKSEYLKAKDKGNKPNVKSEDRDKNEYEEYELSDTGHWENVISKENSIRTDNFMSTIKYRKPKIFIGSSVEGKSIAEAVNVNLEYDAWCTLWPNTIGASGVTIDSLIKNCSDYDFAIFIFSPDDAADMRKATLSVARDNVVFETGLFMGEHGRDRVFIVQPRDIPNFHVLTDLSGFTTVTYESERATRQDELTGAVAAAAGEIKRGIKNSTWSQLKLNIKARSKAEEGKIYPLKIEFEIKNTHVYPVTIQSINFILGDGLKFAPNSSEEQHKPLFLKVKQNSSHQYTEQVTVEHGEQLMSCWLPLDPIIGEKVLRNAIEGGQIGTWTFRCIWIKEHVTVCKYEVKF